MESRAVIRSYLVIAGMYTLSASLIWGVNTLFLLDAGLDIFGVFIANAVFTAGMVIFEIPTGVLADTAGRRASFLLSVLVLGFGTLAYVGVAETSGSLIMFCITSVIMGLGFTFYSGAVEAWLVDALNATDFDGELDPVFAQGARISGATMLVGTIGGGLIGNIDLALPFVGRAALLFAVFAFAWFYMHDIGFEPRAMHLREMPKEMRKIARDSVTYGWQVRPVRLLMVAAFFQTAISMWGFYAWQPYFLELLESDAVWVAGVIAAMVALAMMLGNTMVNWMTQHFNHRTTIMISAAVIYAIATIGVGLVNNFYLAVGAYLVTAVSFGVFGPVRQAYIHHVIPSEQRASVISFDSMISSSGSVGGQTGLGYLSREQGVGPGYIIGGGIAFLAVPFLYLLRREGIEADVIHHEAGIQSPHAGTGIPAVAQHDAKRRTGVTRRIARSLINSVTHSDITDETPSEG